MSLEFDYYKIEDIGEVVSGGTPSTNKNEYWHGDIGWITPKDLSSYDDIYISHGERNISVEGLNNSSAKLVPKNTVLMTSRAPIGYIAIANNELSTNQGFKSLICNEKICHYKYFYYWLKLNIKYIINNSNGSTFKEISGGTFKNLEIALPSLKEQKVISSVLWTIDEKISVLKKVNKNLEQYLKLYFNECFLEYDFNEFSNSNKPIPDSWTLGNFNEIINTLGSGDWGKDELIDNYTSEVFCIRGADIPDVKLGNKGKMPIRFILPKNFENKKLDKNSIVIEISGGSPTQSTGRTVFITKDFLNRFDKDIICTNFCKVIKPKDNYEIFLYLYLNHLYDKDVMFAYENGTTGIKNFDIKSFINNFLIVIPSEEDIIKFNNSVKDVFDIIMHNGLEIEKLANLRDTLLPKLMSGEIDVSQINCDLD